MIYPLIGFLMAIPFGFASDTIYPKDAIPFLEKLDCSFSAFAVYTGPDASSMLGSLKNGQAFSRAICIASYAEGGAKKHDYCWLRPVDMKIGAYVGSARYGDAWRDEGGPCTKESILRILNKGAIKSQLLFGANKDWRVVSDKKGLGANFRDLLVVKTPKAGPLSRFAWKFHEAGNVCTKDDGEADRECKTLVALSADAFKNEGPKKLIMGRKSEAKHSFYYVSKEACESDQTKGSSEESSSQEEE